MGKEWMLLHDGLVLMAAFIAIIYCFLIYRKTKSKGFLLLIIAITYILVIRFMSLYYVITENVEHKAVLSSCVGVFWVLFVISLGIFYKEINRVLK